MARLAPVFKPEWCAIAALALVEIVWAGAIGFHLSLSMAAIVTPLALVFLIAVPRLLGYARASLFFEYGALSLIGSFALVVLSYLCMASAGPVVDAQLLAFDRALGFDWLAIWNLIAQHPLLMRAMEWSYDSLLLQSFYVTIFLGVIGDAATMRNLWRLSTLACALSCLVAIAAPALGPYKVFGLESHGPFLPAMEQLLTRRDLHFVSGSLKGVIEFPSVHTGLALACVWGMRRTGPLFWIFVLMNLAMLFTIPFMGGHYLADMIAGALVFAFSLGVVRLLARHERPAAMALAQPPAQKPVAALC